MKIEDLAVDVRPRKKWESVDLGARMIQNWGRAVYLPYIVVPTLFWILANLLIPADLFIITIFFLWWLKPLWGRIPLFVISRSMFGATPSTLETLKGFPHMLHGLMGALTIFRFSPNRSVTLPILMLENLKGSTRSKRQTVINSRLTGFNTLLCTVFLLVEWLVLFAGIPFFIAGLYPEDLFNPIASLDISGVANWMMTGTYLLAIIIIEPFFVAAGFALYLNSRTLLECWDLELIFRKMATRLAGTPLLLLALTGLILLGPTSLRAGFQEETTPAEAIEEIMAHPDFQRMEKGKVWRFRGERDSTREAPSNMDLGGVGDALALFMRVVFWGIVIAIVLAIIYLLVKIISKVELGSKKETLREAPAPEIAVRDKFLLEALPTDIVKGARDFWGKDMKRQALSTLFRGALRVLSDRGTLEIPDFVTEEECLRLVRRKTHPEFALFFKDLTRSWQSLAYAHRPPDEVLFQELCSQWLTHLGVVK